MRQIIQALLFLLFLTSAVPNASAQGLQVVRGGCMPDMEGEETAVRDGLQRSRRLLPTPSKEWDAEKTYRQLVILFSYSDLSFACENPQEYYQRVFNEPGYNEGAGPGCVADYYREQSGGLFNLQFDVYGPYQVSSKAQPYANPNAGTRNYGYDAMVEATKQMLADNPHLNFAPYDWNGDGYAEQVIYVCAGLSGNQANSACYGYLWPSTGSLGETIPTPDGTMIHNYSASAEHWVNDMSCGIGTICHEFSHSLGLPDIYPTSGSSGYYSVVDEWDLMDGGNFTNYGWCPPNFTAMEKMLMGWTTATELTEPITITGLEPVSRGGEIYSIHHTDNEFLLLENRQQIGWDAGVPGKGLVIYHVDYNRSYWSLNKVNVTKGHFCFDLVHADNLDFKQWDVIRPYADVSVEQYQNSPRMNNWHLSTSPFPWSTDSTAFVNSELTDTSIPATTMFNTNANGSRLLSKAITNITMAADGTVSFDYGGYCPSAVSDIYVPVTATDRLYNLYGQRVDSPGKGIYIRNGKKYRY